MKTRGGYVAALLALSCTGGSGDPAEVAEGFKLTAHDATQIDATIARGGETLRVLVAQTGPQVVDTTFDFGATQVAFHVDFETGEGDILPSGPPLTDAHLRLVDALAAEMDGVLPKDQRTLVENQAERLIAYMQIAPAGELLEPYHFSIQRGWTHISCTCSYQYIGDGYYRTAGKGCGCTGGSGNGCKGRCGQGCGISSTPSCVGYTAYTRDCAKHDWGVGSWWSASDDYTGASNNCSCGGVGYCY